AGPCPDGRAAHARSGAPRRDARRPAARADAKGVRPAPGAAGVRRPRALPRAPAEPRVGVRARRRDRVADRGRPRAPAPRQARRLRQPHRHRQGGGLSLRARMSAGEAFVHFLRRSIARKLTLTLVGFVAVTTLLAGLFLNRALERFAVETLETRLASTGRLVRDLRSSATSRTPLLYVALPVHDGGRIVGVLRLALPLSMVSASWAAVHRVMLGGGLVALVVAFGIGLFVARRVTRPVVEMQ